MKLSIEASDLKHAVRLASIPIDSKHTMSIASSLLLEARKGEGLTVSGTNLASSVSALVEASVESGGSIVVSCTHLQSLVSKLDGEGVKLTLGDTMLELRSGKSKYNFKTQLAKDYPKLHAPPARGFKVPGSAIKQLLDQTQHAMSKDDSRPHLWGVLLEFGGATAVAVATDGRRMAKTTIGLKAPKTAVFVPAPSVAGLSEFCGVLDEDEPVTLCVTEGRLFVWTEDIGYMVQLIEAKPLNYKEAIPSKFAYTAGIYRDQLIAALKRLTVFGEDDKVVRLSLRGGALDLSVSNLASGSGKETLGADYQGEKIARKLSAKQLLEFALVADADVLYLKMNGSDLDPIVFQADKMLGLFMAFVDKES